MDVNYLHQALETEINRIVVMVKSLGMLGEQKLSDELWESVVSLRKQLRILKDETNKTL